jgi:hypothetical protein
MDLSNRVVSIRVGRVSDKSMLTFFMHKHNRRPLQQPSELKSPGGQW